MMVDVITFHDAHPRPPRQPRRAPRWLPAVLVAAALVLVAAALALATAGDDPAPAPTEATVGDHAYAPVPGLPLTTPPAGTTTVTAASSPDAADPYAIWQTLKPADAPDLSRDDALARAIAGCGQAWPPGTTDAALQQAYVGSGRIRCPS
jgi:hypothetical protein